METAPKGGGAELTTDPKWVEPPKILLLFENGEVSVGYWDWYYAEGGAGYSGGLAWIEPLSGERLDLNYDPPIGWMPKPDDRGINPIPLVVTLAMNDLHYWITENGGHYEKKALKAVSDWITKLQTEAGMTATGKSEPPQ